MYPVIHGIPKAEWLTRTPRVASVITPVHGPLFCRPGSSRPRVRTKSRNVSSYEDFAMGDYSSAILALIAVTAVLTTGVVYVLAQPTDVPVAKREG